MSQCPCLELPGSLFSTSDRLVRMCLLVSVSSTALSKAVRKSMKLWGVSGDRRCTDKHTGPFSLRAPHVITRLSQGPDDSLCVWKRHFIIGHVFVECSFDTFSSGFLIVYYHTDATDWNQTKPVSDSALGCTVWPSGRSDSQDRRPWTVELDVWDLGGHLDSHQQG